MQFGVASCRRGTSNGIAEISGPPAIRLQIARKRGATRKLADIVARLLERIWLQWHPSYQK